MKSKLSAFEDRITDDIHRIDRRYDTYAKSVGHTYTSLSVLECIYEQNPCTQKTICEELHISKQTINVIIRGLLEQGHVDLKEFSNDRRNKHITLTASGKAYAEKILLPLWDAETAAALKLSESERETFLRIIETYVQVFEEKLD